MRLFFVLLALADGVSVLIYIVLWIVLPRQGRETDEAATPIAGRVRPMGRAMGGDLREAARNPNPPANAPPAFTSASP